MEFGKEKWVVEISMNNNNRRQIMSAIVVYINIFGFCFPASANCKEFSTSSNSAPRECGLFIGSSWCIGVKYTFFRNIKVAIFFKFAERGLIYGIYRK